jgi:hypothetical protein
MNIQQLTDFFMWCSIINGSILLFWTFWLMFAPGLVYKIQSYFFPISRESFNILMYGFLGAFKLAFIMLNLVPYIALVILGG